MDCTLRYIKENLKKSLLLENKLKKVIFKDLDRNFSLPKKPIPILENYNGIVEPTYALINSKKEIVYNSIGLISHIESTFGKRQKYIHHINDWLLDKYNTSINELDKKVYQQYNIDLSKHITKSKIS